MVALAIYSVLVLGAMLLALALSGRDAMLAVFMVGMLVLALCGSVIRFSRYLNRNQRRYPKP